jgi:prevent-host-death family protein
MKTSWQLQEAKNKLSEVVDRALSDGPQFITRHGRPAVVVISANTYHQAMHQDKLSQVLQACPVKGWKLQRDSDTGRTIQFD